MGRRSIIAFLLIAGLLIAVPTASAHGGSTHCDFNGDGYDDAAIGVPADRVSGVESAGAVNVIYGSEEGLTATGNQRWTQNSAGVGGVAEEQDNFGTGVECGDFNGDSYADLVIGVIGETIGGHFRAGAFHVVFGSSEGLDSTNSLFLHRDIAEVAGAPEANPGFSNSLAVGDFNGDGMDDLAVGAPFDRVKGLYSAGSVHVFMGHTDGLSVDDDKIWHRARPSLKGAIAESQFFGLSLASGDFDGDGHDDLAVGVPFDTVGEAGEAGSVNVIFGSPSGLTGAGDDLIHRATPGVKGVPDHGEYFGRALAAGDFDGDGHDDLAIGVVGDRATDAAGSVQVLFGADGGLKRAGDQMWHRDIPGIRATGEDGDWFGSQLAAGRFDDDSYEDLAIGATGDSIGAAYETGSVHVLRGAANGLTAAGDQVWHQGTAGIKGANEQGDFFAYSIAVGDYDGNGLHDVLVGVPGEDSKSVMGIGRIVVIYATASGLSAVGNQSWNQRTAGIAGVAKTGDQFGSRVSGTPSR